VSFPVNRERSLLLLYANLSYEWLGPGILISMGAAFMLLYLHDRKREPALCLSGSYLIVAVGYTQIVLIGGDLEKSSLAVTLLSANAGLLLLLRGISRLYDRPFPWLVFWLPATVATGVIVSFHDVPSFLWAKVSALYGFAIVIDIACGIIAWRRASHDTDKVIASVFFVQAALTVTQLGLLYMPGAEPLTMATFGASHFAMTLRTTNALFAIALGMALFVRFGAVEVDRLTRLAGTDPLTGLLNRRAFETEAIALRSASAPLPTGLIICDIDHFKRVNDCHGHEVGDRALKAFARLLVREVPETAICTRLGGEEFCILLAGVNGEMIRLQAAQLRLEVERLQVATDTGSLKLTASFGYRELGATEDLRTAMAAVDAAVYQAKNEGRNLVREATPAAVTTGRLQVPDQVRRAL